METLPFWGKVIKICIILSLFISMAPILVWLERRVAGFIQDRLGPNRVGPFGILQPIADAIKLLFKEEFFPEMSAKTLFFLAPFISLFISVLVFGVVPLGAPFEWRGYVIYPQIANLNVGILYVMAISSLGVFGIMIGGWSSNNKFSLLGGLRASSQMISYELSMGLAVVAAVLTYGTLDLQQIVQAQAGWKWGVVLQPLGFIIFLIAAFAESNRIPFDLPEGETEIVAGYHTEYGGMKFGSFFFAEYLNIVTLSSMMVTIFFGGYHGLGWLSTLLNSPPLGNALLQFAAFGMKVNFFLFLFIWVRWTFPRFRYDQIMRLGWKVWIPLGLVNLALTSLLIYWGVM
ncbi:MAG TPA: NADH-quinone oxidoreductase subunit NuoH [Bdellovibrionota bacterium]|nr:NADH-quinone oxidoreductase subunit NuoH [Bdellovibrionota bacterium]